MLWIQQHGYGTLILYTRTYRVTYQGPVGLQSQVFDSEAGLKVVLKPIFYIIAVATLHHCRKRRRTDEDVGTF